MKIQMELLSDAIFGNGMSVPGGEDISVLCDRFGFPYYKGGTLKGIFREELSQYLGWIIKGREGEEEIIQEQAEGQIKELVKELLGETDAFHSDGRKLIFSDFHLSDAVKLAMLKEIGENKPETVLNSLTHLRSFTKISEGGAAEEGSLRSCRCVNKGLFFYGDIQCLESDREMVKEILSLMKWIGTMRNRGFGKVRITVAE